ncbi:conjugal transfer protein MobC [Albibacterium bauzanense]|uniref:YWFCY motif protein n=1 Tax=Albibacterium bauzanense TaxID=653929 RepID=A0A4R1LRP7_9SPHI|nr:conjugal transfer protein MobC [Albibacterium bauzanense]TCK80910.1 YWFCY motif protein [Albibacterium bauzanense]
MRTGENEQGLRKILDFTRLLSIAILIIHFYLSCYVAFSELGLSSEITDKVIRIISNIKIFESTVLSKSAALGLLLISLIGAKGRKDEKTDAKAWIICGILAISLFFGSVLCFRLNLNLKALVSLYIAICSLGYILVLTSGTRLSRLIKFNLMGDIFNRDNETFPQEERKLDNPYSINLPARYYFKGKFRDSWINIINPFRGLLVLGTPGSGKSYFAIRHIISQHIKKGFSMFIYDFKYDDLTRIAYNTLLNDKNPASFYVINFDDLSHTHRCNPLDPNGMTDITDATEAARTIMLGLNREWIKKQGDFFVESPINFLTAVIWYLRKYKDGIYCTLPHVIELMQVEYQFLFAILNREPEIEVLINPFISAWKNEAFDQLEGQVASAKISMAKLSSPALYYVLSGNDFSLDLNNPDDPKIICVGNNPQKQQVYGAVLSLYISRMIKLVNQKDKQKCSLIFDEFPTIYFNNMDSLIATARSNQVATSLAVQDYSQLKKDYGREQAEVILNIVGNVISGQVTGDTAKHLSERFGKIQQQRRSISINSSDTSLSKSTQLDYAIPASKISTLSSGEFVGMVADDPHTEIDLKVFHNKIQNDHGGLKKEETSFKPIPKIRTIDSEIVEMTYFQIKQDVQEILAAELGSNRQNETFSGNNSDQPGNSKMRTMRM